MAKPVKFWGSAALALVLALPALTARAEDVTADTVVATVGDTKITVGNLLVLKERLPAQYQQLPPDVLFKGLVEQLVQQEVLAESVKGALSKSEQIAQANEERSFLAATALDRVAATAVSEEAVRAAYDAEYAKAEPGKEYHAAHILVPTEEEAKSIKAALDKGEDFAALASEKTQDPSGKGNGGDLGWFGLGMMVEPFETAVTGMQPGQVSDPVQTQFGWHVIKLEEVRNASVPTLDEVRPEIEGKLQQEAVEKKIAELTAAAKVTRAEGIDPAVISDTKLLAD